MIKRERAIQAGVLLTVWACTGCVGDARVELAAAQSLDELAGSFDQAIGEYHEETTVHDDEREAAIVSAYLARVRRDADDPAALADHERDLVAALEKLRRDREVEASRFTAARDNVALLRETVSQLRHSAVRAAAISAESRSYVESVVSALSESSAPSQVKAGETSSSGRNRAGGRQAGTR